MDNLMESMLAHTEVEKQVHMLLRVSEKMKADKKPLLGEPNKINLLFSTKKQLRSTQTIKLNLPNGLAQPSKDVCLFVKDIDRKDREYEKTVRHFKTFLRSKGVEGISEIIPLKALKLEYKPYEAKRNLANRFDVFLADARIIRLLPSYLGKAFYGRKRNPIQVRFEAKDLREEIDKAVNNSQCIIKGKGTTLMATVGNSNMSAAELVQNITASVEQISAAISGGPNNIRSFYIKTEDSMALPLYVSLGSTNDVVLPVKEKKVEPVVAEEVTTVENALVKVYPSGRVQLVDDSGNVLGHRKKFTKGRKKPVKRLGRKMVGAKKSTTGRKTENKDRPQKGKSTDKKKVTAVSKNTMTKGGKKK